MAVFREEGGFFAVLSVRVKTARGFAKESKRILVSSIERSEQRTSFFDGGKLLSAKLFEKELPVYGLRGRGYKRRNVHAERISQTKPF